jgi:hypothetical protein
MCGAGKQAHLSQAKTPACTGQFLIELEKILKKIVAKSEIVHCLGSLRHTCLG